MTNTMSSNPAVQRAGGGWGKWFVIAAIIGVLAFVYNGLVSKQENVNGGWSEVQNQLKRRSDVIPNLVKTVQGYASHESDVFKQVAESRAKVGQAISLDVSKLANDPMLQKQLLDAQQSMNASLGRLIAVAEAYPQLKADQGFLKLQDELAGTENRIAVARGRAISATKDYNEAIRQVPGVIIARLGGFTEMKYYEAPESDQKVPNVDFGKKS